LSGWRVLAVVAPAAIVVMVMVAVEREILAPGGSMRVPGPPVVELEPAAPVAPAAGDVPPAWSEVAELTATVPFDELSGATPLRAGTADALVEDLTADERAELLRLLKEAMGGGA
jgi:hypothetical protein